MPNQSKIISSRHPIYREESANREKWRLTYEGGDNFIIKYLTKLSERESDTDFENRRDIAYCPAFASAALDDIKNSIFQRTSDVNRVGGPPTYKKAIDGHLGGVDLAGTNMSTFIGEKVITELLMQAKIGVLVDQLAIPGATELDKGDSHPYLGVYAAEDILNWYPTYPDERGFTSLLLRECVDDADQYGLTTTQTYQYRHMQLINNQVVVSFYNNTGELTNETILNIPRIPFALMELPHSLLKNAANYQIALLNVESSDISFIQKANYPFFFEFFDPRTEPAQMKPKAPPNVAGTNVIQSKSRDREQGIGPMHGRRYPKGTEQPGFTNPSPETLLASMAKSEKIKEDIRLVVNLNLNNMNPLRASAESKMQDTESLEASLSFIGLVLEKGETLIGRFWTYFETSSFEKAPEITYPSTYKIKTDQQRQEEADRLTKIQRAVPSATYQREVAKKIARVTLGGSVMDKTLQTIMEQIDSADSITSDFDKILAAHKEGLCDDVLAATSLGFPKDTVQQAKKDRAERIKLTMEAQGGLENASAARGAPEFEGKQSDSEKEGKRVRGIKDKVESDE